MAITPLPFPTPSSVVGAACAEVDSLHGSLWSARRSEELVAGVEELQRLKAKAAALEAELLAEINARDTARKELAWGSTADWYTHTAGTTHRQGKKTVAQAGILVGERHATLAALRDGTVSPEQASVVVDAVEKLPLTGRVRSDGERRMLTEADRLNASDLRKAGRHLAAVVDPDRADRQAEKALDREDRAAHLGRFLNVSEDGAGGIRVKGRGTVEDGAVLRAALLPLTKPQPAVDPATCAEAPDPRDHGTRMWDAVVQLAQHALNTDLPPTSHGARPRVVVTVDATDLNDSTDTTSAGTGVTDDGVELPGAAVRRLACDCDLIRVVRDTDGCVLDVGRRQRLVTAAIWIALVVRDRHCAFPAAPARR